jgi:LPXTG-motif cell wall-anchored protein
MNMTSYRNLYKKFVFILVVIFTLSMFSGLTFAVNDPSGTLSAWRTSWQTGRINGDEGENLTFRYIPGDLTKEISIQLDYISKNSQIIGLDSSSSWFISKSSDLPLNEIINDTNILKFTPIVNGPSFISNSGSGILEYTVSFPSNLPSLTSNEKWALYFTSHLSETGTENKFLGNGAEVVEGSSYWPGKSLQLTANGNTIAIGVGDLIKNPALSVKKSSPTESITEAGQVVPYTFEVENTGNVDLTNVVVSDPLLDAEPVLSSGDDGDRVLEVDEVWTYTGNHTVTAAELENETLDNTVSVTCAQVGPVSDSLSIPIDIPEIKDDDDDDDDDDDGDDDGDDGDTPTTLVVESAVLPFLEVHAGEIPQTGDTGNAPFAAGGLLFLLFAGLGLYGWFRKEQNVAES